RDGAVPLGTDVEQEITATANDVHEHQGQLATGVVVLYTLGPIVAVAEAHAAALFPGMSCLGHARGVLGGPIAPMPVARLAAPAVVNHDLILYWRLIVEPSQQLEAAPLLRSHLPLAVAEDDRRLVTDDNVLELRHHVLGHIAWFVAKVERVIPLIERIIDTHLQAFGTHCFREVAQQVAVRTQFNGVPWPTPSFGRLFARPQREALMMLGSEGNVLRAGALEDIGPV